jgi:hypothetical protein
MVNRIKKAVADTTAFVKDHKTLVACSATGVGTAAFCSAFYLREMRTFAYNSGHLNGTMAGMLSETLNFIEDQNLTNEFGDYVGRSVIGGFELRDAVQ